MVRVSIDLQRIILKVFFSSAKECRLQAEKLRMNIHQTKEKEIDHSFERLDDEIDQEGEPEKNNFRQFPQNKLGDYNQSSSSVLTQSKWSKFKTSENQDLNLGSMEPKFADNEKFVKPENFLSTSGNIEDASNLIDFHKSERSDISEYQPKLKKARRLEEYDSDDDIVISQDDWNTLNNLK